LPVTGSEPCIYISNGIAISVNPPLPSGAPSTISGWGWGGFILFVGGYQRYWWTRPYGWVGWVDLGIYWSLSENLE